MSTDLTPSEVAAMDDTAAWAVTHLALLGLAEPPPVQPHGEQQATTETLQ